VTEEAEDDLRTTAQATKRDAQRLAQIEAEKLTLAPDDPRLADLAAEATELAERLRKATRYQQALTDELSDGR
jgi:hypothetical protein